MVYLRLMMLGRPGEAIAEMMKAQDLDPPSLIISADMADAPLISHNYEEATSQSRKTIDMILVLRSGITNWARHSHKDIYLSRPLRSEPRFKGLLRRIGLPA